MCKAIMLWLKTANTGFQKVEEREFERGVIAHSVYVLGMGTKPKGSSPYIRSGRIGALRPSLGLETLVPAE